MSIDKICRDCELDISRIRYIVDLRIMDISEFDVILRIDWLMIRGHEGGPESTKFNLIPLIAVAWLLRYSVSR